MARMDFSWNDKIADQTKKIIMDAVQDNALDLKSESSKQAPKKTGDLEDNCNISSWQKDSNGSFLSVGYDLPYARRQHEKPYNHPLKGKWKFLEDPYKENEKRYLANVVKQLKTFFSK